jgi:hypothetical protein
MSLKARYLAPLSVAVGAAASIAVVPHAAADDDPMPTVGQSPVEAIEELEAEGYIVAINWTRGYPEVPLSECTLVAIHNPDGTGPKWNTTVYLDISCPPGDFD